MIFRPRATPSPDIPVGARSVGHYVCEPDWREPPRVKHFVQVFWGIAGRGSMVIHGESLLLEPDHVAVYLPGMTHDIRALDVPWEYRWWTMDGPQALAVTNGFGLKAGVYPAGRAPVELFEKLQVAMQDLSASGERRASALAYNLLSRTAAGRAFGAEDVFIERALDLIHRSWSDPELGVEFVARQIHLHRSTLSRRFQERMGISPMEYIQRLRVQNALSLLKQSTLNVAEIARQCGCRDANYFSRLIRKRTGIAPLAFRKR